MIGTIKKAELTPKCRNVYELVSLSDEQLAQIDPLIMNLLVSSGIPSLSDLDIPRYQHLADVWAVGVQRLIQKHQSHFWLNPGDWKNDMNFFRLGMLCQFIECELGVAYLNSEREIDPIKYVDPSQLFLNGVMDNRQGTCANMATLHVALGWRLGWPVSIACVGSHYICRYDDSKVTHNIEATQSGFGGFKSDPDEYLIEMHRIPHIAISCGSDLRAVKARELLGIFISLRARHFRDVRQNESAERDYLLARHLFPNYRLTAREQLASTALANFDRFEQTEAGHPDTLWAVPHEVRQNLAMTHATTQTWTFGSEQQSLYCIPTFATYHQVGFRGGDTNLHRYVGNDATNNADMSGLLDMPVVRPNPVLLFPIPQKSLPQGPPGDDDSDLSPTEEALLSSLKTDRPGYEYRIGFQTPTGWDNAGRFFLQAITKTFFLVDENGTAFDVKGAVNHEKYTIDQVRVAPGSKNVPDIHIHDLFVHPTNKDTKFALVIIKVTSSFGPSKTTSYRPLNPSNSETAPSTINNVTLKEYNDVKAQIDNAPGSNAPRSYEYYYIYYKPVPKPGHPG